MSVQDPTRDPLYSLVRQGLLHHLSQGALSLWEAEEIFDEAWSLCSQETPEDIQEAARLGLYDREGEVAYIDQSSAELHLFFQQVFQSLMLAKSDLESQENQPLPGQIKKSVLQAANKLKTSEDTKTVLIQFTEQVAMRLAYDWQPEEKQKNSEKAFTIGNDPAMLRINEQIRLMASSPQAVLIQGESGTGKELVARGLHAESYRREKHFVDVNCGAIPKELLESELFGSVPGAFNGARNREGFFEMAHEGTIFLDEISELIPDHQVKLLRVLREQVVRRVGSNENIQIDVRVIAATNRDLKKWVAQGEFREDLYYRLNRLEIHLPPLRERPDQLFELVEYFMYRYCETERRASYTLSQEVHDLFRDYPWPGNVGELENVIGHFVVMAQGSEVQISDLKEDLQEFYRTRCRRGEILDKMKENNWREAIVANQLDMSKEAVCDVFKSILLETLDKSARPQVKQAAAFLGMNRELVYSKLKQYGIQIQPTESAD